MLAVVNAWQAFKTTLTKPEDKMTLEARDLKISGLLATLAVTHHEVVDFNRRGGAEPYLTNIEQSGYLQPIA